MRQFNFRQGVWERPSQEIYIGTEGVSNSDIFLEMELGSEKFQLKGKFHMLKTADLAGDFQELL